MMEITCNNKQTILNKGKYRVKSWCKVVNSV